MGSASTYQVLLLGFSAFERSALGSCFRLALQRPVAYLPAASLAGADFIVVDVDHADGVHAVLAGGREADTVFVGGPAPPGGAAWLMRPIDPRYVMRELDRLVLQRGGGPVHGGPTAVRADGPSRRAGDAGLEDTAVRGALLVDGSGVGLRTLGRHLHRRGLYTLAARTAAQAMAVLVKTPVDFVFIGIGAREASALDGLDLCLAIRRLPPARDAAPPWLVMVGALQDETLRVRAALAGCDATLKHPVAEAQVDRLLVEHGARRPTAVG